MPEVWQMTCADFIGDWPVHRYDADEARRLERGLMRDVLDAANGWVVDGRAVDGWDPRHLRRVVGTECYLAPTRADDEAEGVLLLSGDDVLGEMTVCGGYIGAALWIEPAMRGRGLAAELVLARAELSGGRLCPLSYTRAGLAAHRAAHRLAVRRAVTAGQRIPAAVWAEDASGDDGLAGRVHVHRLAPAGEGGGRRAAA